jgi:CspA family cold shock protein
MLGRAFAMANDNVVENGSTGLKATGKVKWFNNAKGYGFILPDDGGDDLFAHYSSIEMDGYKTLKAGQEVCFEVLAGPKGKHATHIQAGAEAPDEEASSPADVHVDAFNLNGTESASKPSVASVSLDAEKPLENGERLPASHSN